MLAVVGLVVLISQAEVLADRRMAEAEMIDTCRITKDGVGPKVWDENTLQYTLPPRVVVYEGKCRVQVRSDINSNAVEAVVAEHEWTYRTATLMLPIDGSEEVSTDHQAEIIACPLDPGMVGRLLNLQADTKGKTHASCRRFRTRELLG